MLVTPSAGARNSIAIFVSSTVRTHCHVLSPTPSFRFLGSNPSAFKFPSNDA